MNKITISMSFVAGCALCMPVLAQTAGDHGDKHPTAEHHDAAKADAHADHKDAKAPAGHKGEDHHAEAGKASDPHEKK